MTIYTEWSAGDACDLSMTKYYCMDFGATDGDPERFREIVGRERQAGRLKPGRCVKLLGPKIEDLQKRVNFDLTVFQVAEVLKVIPQSSQYDNEELTAHIALAIQARLNEALTSDNIKNLNKTYRACYFIRDRRDGDSFRVTSRKFTNFNKVEGFTRGSEEMLEKIALRVAEVARVLKEEIENGSFQEEVLHHLEDRKRSMAEYLQQRPKRPRH